MLRDRHRQAVVLKLFRQACPPGQDLRSGMSVIDVILDHEFGPASE